MGIDIAVGYGTPIAASASGTVIFSGWMGGYGNFVIVDHGGGLSTAYAHMSSIGVGGGSVAQGQVLGYVGLHRSLLRRRISISKSGSTARPSTRSGTSPRAFSAWLIFGARTPCAEVQVGQVPVALVEVEPVADEELVRHREARRSARVGRRRAAGRGGRGTSPPRATPALAETVSGTRS